MRILGHGIDIVETARIAQMIERHGDHFLHRVFTAEELAYANENTKRRVEHLAGRFAAKEAILKVLGTGWSGGIAWTDAQVIRQPTGRPTVQLHNRCLEISNQLGIYEWWLSISHIKTHATASAIAVGA